ncbi:RNA polymerase factor sigma-54 [Myroides ceti]|uniref:RNA polymerase factor sigma-54 n=1 Tax=Paenimyroides ceti TaxID=395087 RepID=A0ABT8CZY5_9FLAO|nr:RNA polymerase factor sigma-54 [Paenimyroides ceti]MDN3706492.1 RNA polymerase factor sigma-54 [Paenimyroides ceti]MDN3709779.1 RNA polymerase factor sigma-54 [Paenimyroides ceti]MDN3709800.1 RNA polymerase factor sigma-54 [Paenimyroides ceti]
MLKQNLQLKLSQKLSPQQIQLMKLIQLPTLAFEQRLKEELVENPALESGKEDNVEADEFGEQDDFDDYDNERIDTDEINIDEYLSDDETPDYKLQTNNYSDDDDDKFSPIVAQISFHQDLINQLNTFMLNDEDRVIAEFLVGSIDDMGYIRRSIQDIVDDMAFTQGIYTDEEKVTDILLNIIHELEPSGVGARDLQECLLLQLRHKTPSDAVELATDIIENQFDAFTKKHYEKLLQKYGVSQDQLRKAIDEIEKLNPKPGGAFAGNSKAVEHVIPDFTIKINDGELELSLNGRNAPELHVSKDYQEMLETYKASADKSNAQKDAVQFIKQKLDGAKWFIDAIKQRQETLFVTMSAIIQYQQEYFLDGDETKLKPMILKDIADMVGLDISTISRVANSKYVETPYGTKLIKEFFSEAMINDQGEEVSTIEIKKILQNIIADEDKQKPYPDDRLAELLKEKGYPIARRTVAKYREQLDIPVARMRKKI